MISLQFGSVASGHPQVSQAALDILQSGGNAFDAIIAAGLTSAVAEAALTSLGGGGFLLAHTSSGKEILFDFFTDTPGKGMPGTNLDPHFFPITVHFPGSDQVFNVGLGSVAVPGNLKGFLHVHDRLGRLPLRQVIEPALLAARTGVELNRHQAYFMELLKPITTLTRESENIFCPGDTYPACGDIHRNPELADFLENLPRDMGKNFYEGDIARNIICDMRSSSGLLTLVDLAGYRVIERRPLARRYRRKTFLTNPFPSFGGPLIATALAHLEKLPLSQIAWGSAEYLLAHACTMQEVDRLRSVVNHEIPFVSDKWLHNVSALVRLNGRGTTHVSVVDKEGNAASMTTSNGEGSGYIAPGTGIMLNNMLGEDDLHPDGFHSSPPGKRISSMMSPSMLMNDAGLPEIILGSGGSKRIRTAITQVVTNLIDFNLDIKKAVESPRIHWDGKFLQLEPGFSDDAVAALNTEIALNRWEALDLYFGGVHAIYHGMGAGDPRRGGDARNV